MRALRVVLVVDMKPPLLVGVIGEGVSGVGDVARIANPFFIQPADDYIIRGGLGVQVVNVVMVLLHHSGTFPVVKPRRIAQKTVKNAENGYFEARA